MARTVTLAALRLRVRQRADMVNSAFIDATPGGEMDGYINDSIAAFNDLINTSYGDNYNLTSTTITTVAGTDTYSLPAAFYKLKGAPRVLQSGTLYARMRRFDMQDLDSSSQSGWTTYGGATDARYLIIGNDKIQFLPAPSGVHTVKLYYVAAAAVLSAVNDTIDGINGWDEYVVIDAAIKCLAKEDGDVRFLVGERDRIERRIRENAANRDAAEGAVVRDVYAWTSDEGEWC